MKKLIWLVFILVLLVIPTTALAASITTDDLRGSNDPMTEEFIDGAVPLAAGQYIIIGSEYATEYQLKLWQDEVARIAALTSPMDYFDDVTKALIQSLVPNAAALVCNEFEPIVLGGFEEDLDHNVVLNFSFPTQYNRDQNIVILVGIADGINPASALDQNGNTAENIKMTWTVLNGAVYEENGSIDIDFPPEIVLGIQNNVALLMVLND